MILLRILLAALATLLIGFVWYHPRVFGVRWMRLVNLSPEMVERGKRRATFFMLAALVCGALLAAASQMIFHAAGVTSFTGACLFSVIAWLGFIAPTELLETLWEERPLSLFFINTSYWFVTMVVVACILVS